MTTIFPSIPFIWKHRYVKLSSLPPPPVRRKTSRNRTGRKRKQLWTRKVFFRLLPEISSMVELNRCSETEQSRAWCLFSMAKHLHLCRRRIIGVIFDGIYSLLLVGSSLFSFTLEPPEFRVLLPQISLRKFAL